MVVLSFTWRGGGADRWDRGLHSPGPTTGSGGEQVERAGLDLRDAAGGDGPFGAGGGRIPLVADRGEVVGVLGDGLVGGPPGAPDVLVRRSRRSSWTAWSPRRP